MLFYFIQTNFTNIALVFFLYIFLFTGTTLSKPQLRIFITATVILNILIIADAADFYLSTLDVPHTLRYITSAAGYSLRPAAICFMTLVSHKLTKKQELLLLTPLALNAAVAFTSILTHNMFYFDSSNQFHRAFLGFLPFIISGIYLFSLLVGSIKKYRIGNKLEAAVVIFIAIMAVTAVIMESLFHFKFIINGVGGASIIFYYAFLNTQTYKRDAMTNALNRHSFYTDIERMSGKRMAIVSIDLNNLKKINDTEGHEAGDAAIIDVAQTTFLNIPLRYKFYRMGGDEFVLLCPKTGEKDAKTIMEKIASDIERKGYQIAWGSAQYEPGMSFVDTLSLSDERMYENKRFLKSNKQEEIL